MLNGPPPKAARLRREEVVLRIETQKIKFDMEAEISGFLHIVAAEGATCGIGTVVGCIAESKEELVEVQKAMPSVGDAAEPEAAAQAALSRVQASPREGR